MTAIERELEVQRSSMEEQPAALLQNVTKQYPGHRALDGLSFSLRAGEIVALLGPNGAGKTTAIRVLLGLTSPTSGEARLFGRSPRVRAARTHVGAMLQVGRMPESLRVCEHIELFRGYYPRPLPLQEILRIAGLASVSQKLFGDLSGGQKQRVLFALALAGDPDLLFLDEPTLGMDIEARRALWAEVRSLAARGKTVLLTTHYLEEAEALASRILLLKNGRLLVEGTPGELRARAGASRIRCRTQLSEPFLLGMPEVKELRREGDRWLLCTDAPEAVLRVLLQADQALSGLEVSPMPFEEAFLSLTGDAVAEPAAMGQGGLA
ncbi:ABC transporter ATP-binding protein [Acidipila sp. EB88]|nr:ABC transporter ATP-binding protein [Acidipila sp. EB88]RRA50294.1 ABC transporter ATP-binding protein [Acidipila sp. EB88]